MAEYIRCFEKYSSNNLDMNFIFEATNKFKKNNMIFTKNFKILLGIVIANSLSDELCENYTQTLKRSTKY